MSLTSRALLYGICTLAVLAPILIAWLWSRPPGRHPNRQTVVLAGGLVTGQLLALASIFLLLNNQFLFFTTWSELIGARGKLAPISTVGLTAGNGTIKVVSVVGKKSGGSQDVLIWLPAQYDDPAYSKTKFPVVMFLPGQPSAPSAAFSNFHFGDTATKLINDGAIKPFVAVFPNIMLTPPRDTECTDVPGGPLANSWLASDVPTGIAAQLRVEPPGAHWSVMGYSTGAFCAAKLALGHPKTFGAGVAMGGYYQPITDDTTGDLFHGNTAVFNANSPLWLYQHHGLSSGNLLMIAGGGDRESAHSQGLMAAAAKDDPHVKSVIFPGGSHAPSSYQPYVHPGLVWLDSVHAFG